MQEEVEGNIGRRRVTDPNGSCSTHKPFFLRLLCCFKDSSKKPNKKEQMSYLVNNEINKKSGSNKSKNSSEENEIVSFDHFSKDIISSVNPCEQMAVLNEVHRKSRYDECLGINQAQITNAIHSQVCDDENESEIK